MYENQDFHELMLVMYMQLTFLCLLFPCVLVIHCQSQKKQFILILLLLPLTQSIRG